MSSAAEPSVPMPEKRRIIVAPWRNIDEFQGVFNDLYGTERTVEMRQRALSQMNVWNLRRSVLCPAGVLATSVLLEAQLRDDEGRYEPDEMQTLYANAFMRFFNFMSSIMQTHNMRTMYETARLLGLDSFVVDMRHLCAHGQQLPPLELLRNTTDYCMRWLGDYFWRSQLANMREVDAKQLRRKDRTLVDDQLLHYFIVYDAALECNLKGSTDLKNSKRHVHGKHYTALRNYCGMRQLTDLPSIFEMLVLDLSELLKKECNMKDISAIYVDALMHMKYFFIVTKQVKAEKSELLIKLTQGLFRMMAYHGLLEELFHALLQHAESTVVDMRRRAGASFWATAVANGYVALRKCKQLYKDECDKKECAMENIFASINVGQMPKAVRRLLLLNDVDLERSLIFGDSIKRPWVWQLDRNYVENLLETLNEFTAPVIKALLPIVEPPLTESEMQTISMLIDALLNGSSHSFDGDDVDKIYTADDLMQRLHQQTNLRSVLLNSFKLPSNDVEEKPKHYGLWSAAPDDVNNWAICPLGKLPWN